MHLQGSKAIHHHQTIRSKEGWGSSCTLWHPSIDPTIRTKMATNWLPRNRNKEVLQEDMLSSTRVRWCLRCNQRETSFSLDPSRLVYQQGWKKHLQEICQVLPIQRTKVWLSLLLKANLRQRYLRKGCMRKVRLWLQVPLCRKTILRMQGQDLRRIWKVLWIMQI